MDLSDGNGKISASYEQDAFGNVLSGSSAGYHFTTKRLYPSIGLYYFFFRWYDSRTGRFIQKSLVMRHTKHPYTFVINNPIMFIDVFGLLQCVPDSTGNLICFPDPPPPSFSPDGRDWSDLVARDHDGCPDWWDPHPDDSRYPAGWKDPAGRNHVNPNSPDVGPEPPFGVEYPKSNAGAWTPPDWDDAAFTCVGVASVLVCPAPGIIIPVFSLYIDCPPAWLQ